MTPEVSRRLDRFDAAIQPLRAQHAPDGPGFCAALVADGQALRSVHHGMANLEWQQPLAGDTRCYLASESKPWVAALVLDAVAEGRLALDKDLRPQLPALASYAQPVCAGHLLRHTSGIADYLFLWGAQLGHHANDVVTQTQALDLIRRADDVSFTPGARHDYSNSNYVLLAEWLQQDADCRLDALAHRRFFEPWGLRDTSFEDQPWRVLPRRARSYGRATPEAHEWHELPVALATWGDGGLWSTLDDLVRAEGRWLDDWRHHGDHSLLARCCAEDQRFGPAAEPYRFGLELLPHAGRRFMFHGGAYAGFTSLVLRCPADGLSLLLLSNAQGFDASATTWLDRLWGPDAEPTPS
ncbi:serine hydrolase domain-containing protein [Ideonella sp.]|uniref:serine hydrolase domain-containing protein n=1 Tax=Ideonella sp. TaxID=1929293 RepID=UPI0035B25C52